jgi:molybdenum cofactor biosynthesis protein B
MERVFESLNIAVVAVSEVAFLADEPSAQLIIDRMSAAGHKITQRAVVADAVQPIRALLLEHIADAAIDVVIIVAGLQSEATGVALDRFITHPFHGFSDLLRMLAYQEMGSAAMLVDAEAALCKSTIVFVVPAWVPSVKLALDRLLIPQLDYRTKPRNLVMSIPRIGYEETGIDEPVEPPAGSPWIVPRAPGDPPVPAVFPPRATTPIASRASTSMSVAEALPKPSTSVSVSEVLPKAPAPAPVSVSVSQQLPAVNGFSARETTNVGPPPPPPPRARITSTMPTPMPVRPPAKLIPLAALLPLPSDTTPAAPPRSPTLPPENVPSVVVDKELSSPVALKVARPMSSLADLEDEGDDLDELPDSVAEIVNEPPTRDQPRATLPPRRVEQPFDDSPRRIAIPREPRRRGGMIALLFLGVALIAAVGVLTFSVIRNHDRDAQAAGDLHPGLVATREPAPASPPVQEQAPPPAPPPPVETTPPPTEPATPPSEIDMSVPDPTAPPKQPTTTTPTTATNPTATTTPVTPKQPKQPRPPKDPATAPVSDPADVLATAPISKVEDGCDEVSCILGKYAAPCCARFKPPEPDVPPAKPASGLPEKIDRLMVQEALGAVKPAVIACGEQSGVHGTVKLQVKVSPDGKITNVSVVSTPDPALGACAASIVQKAKFPETDDGGSFSYPFVF